MVTDLNLNIDFKLKKKENLFVKRKTNNKRERRKKTDSCFNLFEFIKKQNKTKNKKS